MHSDLRDDLGHAKVAITNYHAFRRREKFKASKLTKDLLSKDGEQSPALIESVGEMVNRVCRELGKPKRSFSAGNSSALGGACTR